MFVVFFFFSVRSQQKRLAVRAAGASIRQDSFSRGSRASQFHSPSHLAQRCARGGREQARCNHHRRRRRRRRKKAAADIRHLSSSDAGEPAPGLMVLRRGSQAASQQQGREEPRGHPLSLSFFLLARRRKGEREREREREEAKRKECEGRRLDQRALRRKKKSLSKKRREGKKKNPSSSSRSSPLRATPSRSHGTFPDPGGEARPSLYPGDCRMAPGALALALRARALHRVGKKKRRRKKKKKKSRRRRRSSPISFALGPSAQSTITITPWPRVARRVYSCLRICFSTIKGHGLRARARGELMMKSREEIFLFLLSPAPPLDRFFVGPSRLCPWRSRHSIG